MYLQALNLLVIMGQLKQKRSPAQSRMTGCGLITESDWETNVTDKLLPVPGVADVDG